MRFKIVALVWLPWTAYLHPQTKDVQDLISNRLELRANREAILENLVPTGSQTGSILNTTNLFPNIDLVGGDFNSSNRIDIADSPSATAIHRRIGYAGSDLMTRKYLYRWIAERRGRHNIYPLRSVRCHESDSSCQKNPAKLHPD